MGCAKQLIPRPTGSTATADRRSTRRMQRAKAGFRPRTHAVVTAGSALMASAWAAAGRSINSVFAFV